MTSPRDHQHQAEDLDTLLDHVRRWCAKTCGRWPESITIRLSRGGKMVFPIEPPRFIGAGQEPDAREGK